MTFKLHDHESIFFPEENFSKDEYEVIDLFLQTEWERRVNYHLSHEKRIGGSSKYDPNNTISHNSILSPLIDIAERGKNGKSVSSSERMANRKNYKEVVKQNTQE